MGPHALPPDFCQDLQAPFGHKVPLGALPVQQLLELASWAVGRGSNKQLGSAGRTTEGKREGVPGRGITQAVGGGTFKLCPSPPTLNGQLSSLWNKSLAPPPCRSQGRSRELHPLLAGKEWGCWGGGLCKPHFNCKRSAVWPSLAYTVRGKCCPPHGAFT